MLIRKHLAKSISKKLTLKNRLSTHLFAYFNFQIIHNICYEEIPLTNFLKQNATITPHIANSIFKNEAVDEANITNNLSFSS